MAYPECMNSARLAYRCLIPRGPDCLRELEKHNATYLLEKHSASAEATSVPIPLPMAENAAFFIHHNLPKICRECPVFAQAYPEIAEELKKSD